MAENDNDNRDQFVKRQVERLRDSKGRFLAKGLKEEESSRAKATTGLKSYLETLTRSTAAINANLAAMKRSSEGALSHRNNLEAANRSTQSLTGSLLKLTAALGGVYAAWRALKSAGGFIGPLARTRDLAQALGGSFRDVNRLLPHQRDASLFSAFGQQGLTQRFAGQQEISGLLKIRDALQAKLGEEAGREITLKLTESLRNSRQELSQFLSIASVDLPRALKVFQSADVEAFSTALHAVNQKQSELSKTTSTIEKAWRDIKDSFEQFATSFIETHGGDIRQVVRNLSQSFVDAINWGRQWASEMGSVFTFILEGFKRIQIAADFWSGKTFEREGTVAVNWWKDKELGKQQAALLAASKAARARGDIATAKDLDTQIREIGIKREALLKESKGVFQAPEIPKFKLPEWVEKVVLETGKSTQEIEKATEKTRKWQQELTKVLTPIEAATIEFERLGERIELSKAESAVYQSRIRALESSPLGFGSLYKAQVEGAQQINRELRLLQQQYQTQQKIVQENERMGREGREDRIKLLELETEINNTVAERNTLLKSQTRGYLDAVQALSMGAGRFEKIIISQDKNVGAALRLGMVARNPLLGVEGQVSRVSPFRFGTDMQANFAGAERYSQDLAGLWKQHGFVQAPLPAVQQEIMGAQVSGTTTRKGTAENLFREAGRIFGTLEQMFREERQASVSSPQGVQALG